MNFKKLKELYDKNQHHISPAVQLARQVVYNIIEMREKSTLIDYVDLGFSVKENYDDIYGESTPHSFFTNKRWAPTFAVSFHTFLVSLIEQTNGKKIRTVKNNGSTHAMVAEIEGALFGWVTTNERVEGFYTTIETAEAVMKSLEKMFWERFPDGRVVVSIENERLSIKEDVSHSAFIKFKKCEEYASYIRKFHDGGMARSLLFYGPPGSGKSNLVKGITASLNSKCMRFNNLSDMTSSFVAEILRTVDPDCIILEDIDHMDNEEITDLLDKVEDFNNQKKLVFATANEVAKLDNALLRPGRFNETIEIKRLDDEVLVSLVGNDSELFELVKDFPVAFTVELMKRIKILGKEEALKSIADIHDRIANFENVNYELRQKTSRRKGTTDAAETYKGSSKWSSLRRSGTSLFHSGLRRKKGKAYNEDDE